MTPQIKNVDKWAKRKAERMDRRDRPRYPELRPGEKALGLRRHRADLPVNVVREPLPVSRNKYNP